MSNKTAKAPVVDNYPALADWLNQNHSHCQSQTTIGRDRASLETWLVAGVQVVIMIHADQRGFEIFTSHWSNSIEATLQDANERSAAFKENP